jgi:hypothetical protein
MSTSDTQAQQTVCCSPRYCSVSLQRCELAGLQLSVACGRFPVSARAVRAWLEPQRSSMRSQHAHAESSAAHSWRRAPGGDAPTVSSPCGLALTHIAAPPAVAPTPCEGQQ